MTKKLTRAEIKKGLSVNINDKEIKVKALSGSAGVRSVEDLQKNPNDALKRTILLVLEQNDIENKEEFFEDLLLCEMMEVMDAFSTLNNLGA